MKEIELPDGSIAEFPDDMHDDAIGEVLRKQYAPTPEPTKRQPASFLKRALAGLADPIYGAAQIADKVIDPVRQAISPGASSMADVIKQRDAEYQAPEGFDAARLVGNVANPVSWMGGGAGTLRAAGNAAVQSALQPVSPDANFLAEKAKQAGIGAAGGAVLSKAMRGFTPTPEAKALIEEGVQPTFGQSMGGMANKLEQQMTSIPLVGDAINYARNRALSEFEQKALERATDKTGIKTLEEANQYAGQLYQEVVPHLKPTQQAVVGIQASVRNAMNNPEMTDQSKQVLAGLVEKHGQSFGQLSGEGIKKLDSELGYLARKYMGGDPASKTLAEEIYNVQGALRTGLEHGLPAEMQGKLQAANKVWKETIPINKAASQRADERIMPRALQRAIAQQAKTDVTRMKPDDLIDNAVAVLPSNVPDSGTAGRLLSYSALTGGGLASGTLPQILAGGALAGAGAARPVQRALVGNTAWQKALNPYDAQVAAAMAAALRGQGGPAQ
jgi:hypothetical protein